MSNIKFFVEGIPKGQPRARAFSRGGKAHVYDPGTAEGWKSLIALSAKANIPQVQFEGPISIILIFVLPRPMRLKTKKIKTGEYVLHTSRPDIDNLSKAVMDALTQIGIWRDDAQVWSLAARKSYTWSVYPYPGVEIIIETK